MGLFGRKKATDAESLGLGLPPGGDHYRAFVGPPEDYDLVSAMTFNLLTCLGLRQHHRVLDVGCGSLRIGRLLIPYLNAENYTGVEPNEWLIQGGITQELGKDQVAIKRPTFHISDNARDLPADAKFNFAFAQSIFSHCGPDLFSQWLHEISERLADDGVLAGTYLIAEEDCALSGWIYPGCVYYRAETVARMAEEAGLKFMVLDWRHPRQTWALFSKPGFDVSWIRAGQVSWNDLMSR
ncbi:class I SAM-dependent methyltransferase [Rhodanobacter sp. 7MK24]|uniref:class I SAM-dependent methyltransferase n=1 Tax=Rhodanobacter sp. 7MK24 TaxID=2775922 RepID=UPI001781B113|nr:class I SAM-dependent methyltransferase [Rhodanobacter sp. 7MK24]MBD8879454.1 class I SAM-dependent methyltransferase [Rhodanobacter sp. 7MK24]